MPAGSFSRNWSNTGRSRKNEDSFVVIDSVTARASASRAEAKLADQRLRILEAEAPHDGCEPGFDLLGIGLGERQSGPAPEHLRQISDLILVHGRA